MIKETIIAHKKTSDFYNYTIQTHEHSNDIQEGLELLVKLITTRVLQDVYEYEIGLTSYQFGNSDDWCVRYGDLSKNEFFYVEFFDYWSEQAATENIGGVAGLMLYKIKGLKIITRENLLSIIESWKQVYQEKSNYVIITRDDQGWIDLRGFQEL